ncbi:MAG: hypothetical protein HY658_02420 [Actinobacteria bacterium]|nr:hypothetical protein [Actinomycetota bacterium]
MGYKRERLGPKISAAARSGDRYRDVHVFFGGTGAVGGTALLQMLSIYEEMFAVAPPGPDDVPVLVTTAVTGPELRQFERRLRRFLQSRGAPAPSRMGSGLITASGVFVAQERFGIAALPGLRGIRSRSPDERGRQVEAFLAELGASLGDGARRVREALEAAIEAAAPFTAFLKAYRERWLGPRGIERYRSVQVGIPIPSVVAYHEGDLSAAVEQVDGLGPEDVQDLKTRFLHALRDDLAVVRESLADEVLIAHTTGVGGMYDEGPDGNGGVSTEIRLGFAHAARDRFLADKHVFAERITGLYREAGLKTLITAAAIGVDEVRVRERIPLHGAVRERLLDVKVDELFPRDPQDDGPGRAKAGHRREREERIGHYIRAHRPLTVPLDGPPSEPALFDRGEEIRPPYVIRSGENGFFSVANAEALYRVMRVASASELALVLARVGLFGDDPLFPWFPDGVCYYPETDNARQVLDFLAQPALRRTQLSGLDPMALQDLGSAKHQAELHSLALLILLHRLRTLVVAAIDPYVDPERFDAETFFVERSRTLSFEDVATWETSDLAADLQRLVGAEAPEELLPLVPPRDFTLFPGRQEALLEILRRVLLAVWIPPSLGSPIVFERDGSTWVRMGYYVAPLDLLVTHADDLDRAIRRAHRESGNPCSAEEFRDYQFAVGGVVDVRPHAVLCTARSAGEDLRGRVRTFGDEASFREALREVEPYSFFSTCGLLALVVRLRGLYGQLREAMIELGTVQEFRWHMPRDGAGRVLLVPGIVEAFRMVAEGQEKTTGTERLDGGWGYERRDPPDRRAEIPGVRLDGD